MGSRPGGETETLVSNTLGDLKTRAQTGSVKKLKQVFTILLKSHESCYLMMSLRQDLCLISAAWQLTASSAEHDNTNYLMISVV